MRKKAQLDKRRVLVFENKGDIHKLPGSPVKTPGTVLPAEQAGATPQRTAAGTVTIQRGEG